MLQIFYQTRNIQGLILSMSPVLAFLLRDMPLSFWLPFCCSACLSAVPLRSALQNIPFRLITSLCGLSFFVGVFADMLLSAVLTGIAACGLLLLLPPLVTEGWFRKSWSVRLGSVWSAAFLAVPVFRYLLFQSGTAGQAGAFLLTSAGLLLFLERPPVNWQIITYPSAADIREKFRKPAFYTASIAAALGIAYCMASVNYDLSSGMDAVQLPPLWLLLSPAPLAAAFFIERKGIFSGCVLLIFFCESSTLLLGFLTGSTAAVSGIILLSLAAGSLPVTVPVLCFYLYGHANYFRGFCRMAGFIPLGLLCAVPILQMAEENTLSPDEPAVLLLFLLILSFFCIFFAWKQRFIILKNEIL